MAPSATPSATVYQVAILGCGPRGTTAARAYHHHPRTEVVGVCDLVAERRDELGSRLDLPPSSRFADLHQLVEKTLPHIVVVPTASELHFPLCMAVMEHAPINIDVEKPMAVDLPEADCLVARAEESGCQIAVHHQGRTGPDMRAVSRALADGLIGEPRYLVAAGKGYYGGYDLMNIGTHVINSMFEIAGRCTRVSASATIGGQRPSPADVAPSPNGMGTIIGENITSILEFDSGLTATMTNRRRAGGSAGATGFIIHGTEGQLALRTRSSHIRHVFEGDATEPGPAWVPLEHEQLDLPQEVNAGEHLYVEEYVNALDEGRPHRCSGRQGLHVVEVAMAIFESAAERHTVELPQADRAEHPLLRWRRQSGETAPLREMPRDYAEWLQVEDARIAQRRCQPTARPMSSSIAAAGDATARGSWPRSNAPTQPSWSWDGWTPRK